MLFYLTLLRSDRIMVLDKGLIVEFDAPQELLKNKSSQFYLLVKESRRKEKRWISYFLYLIRIFFLFKTNPLLLFHWTQNICNAQVFDWEGRKHNEMIFNK